MVIFVVNRPVVAMSFVRSLSIVPNYIINNSCLHNQEDVSVQNTYRSMFEGPIVPSVNLSCMKIFILMKWLTIKCIFLSRIYFYKFCFRFSRIAFSYRYTSITFMEVASANKKFSNFDWLKGNNTNIIEKMHKRNPKWTSYHDILSVMT